MRNFRKTFIDAEVTWEIGCRLLPKEHHRIDILSLPVTQPKLASAAGLTHLAFTLASLQDLTCLDHRGEASGFLPAIYLNHGPTMSMYH